MASVQRQMCAAAACSVAAAYAPSTTKEAGELQAAVLDAIDAAQMEADDETFAALSDLLGEKTIGSGTAKELLALL